MTDTDDKPLELDRQDVLELLAVTQGSALTAYSAIAEHIENTGGLDLVKALAEIGATLEWTSHFAAKYFADVAGSVHLPQAHVDSVWENSRTLMRSLVEMFEKREAMFKPFYQSYYASTGRGAPTEIGERPVETVNTGQYL